MAPEAIAKTENQKYCAECGAVILKRAEICPKCGVRQQAPPFFSPPVVAPNGKSRIAAALLAFFLGGFGIHKFYLGQTGWGVVYLLFCWTLIPAIAAFVEVIILITMSDARFAEKYGHA